MTVFINSERFWIDTDPGLDDALAILVAISSAGGRIAGFSSVVGNVSEPRAARNLARLIKAMREAGGLPKDWGPKMARGSQTALLGVPVHGGAESGDSYHGFDGMADMPWPDELGWEYGSTLSAAQMIVNAAKDSGTLRIVCLGPLTNLALALRLQPELPKFVQSVTVMGGSLHAGGNATMAAEFNFAVDPEAAHIVLQAGFRDFSLVPIDACQDAGLHRADCNSIAEINSPAARLFSDLLWQWSDRIENGNRLIVYDVIAWMLTLHPLLAEWQPLFVDVDTGAGLARGASLVDCRSSCQNKPNLRAATSVRDRSNLVRYLLMHLASGQEGQELKYE